jgi:hypothetical protein
MLPRLGHLIFLNTSSIDIPQRPSLARSENKPELHHTGHRYLNEKVERVYIRPSSSNKICNLLSMTITHRSGFKYAMTKVN